MSSSSTTVTIPDHYDIHIGGEPVPLKTDSEIKLDPITVNSFSKSDSGAKLDLTAEIDTKSAIDLKAAIDSKSLVDSKSLIDVKPLAIDSCQTLKLAPLPPVCMEQPYAHHFGFTWMGVELFGFSMHGKQDTFLTSPVKPRHFNVSPRESYAAPCGPCEEQKPRPPHKSGLRVKIGE